MKKLPAEILIDLYQKEGYTPKEVVTELTGLLGSAILASGKDSVEFENHSFNVSVKVIDHQKLDS